MVEGDAAEVVLLLLILEIISPSSSAPIGEGMVVVVVGMASTPTGGLPFFDVPPPQAAVYDVDDSSTCTNGLAIEWSFEEWSGVAEYEDEEGLLKFELSAWRIWLD